MDMCHCIALSVALSVLLLWSSCTAIDRGNNGLLDKLHKSSTVKGTREHVPANDKISATSHRRRPRELLEIEDVKDDLQNLLKAVEGIGDQYGQLNFNLSKQRTSVELLEQNLDVAKDDINKTQSNILLLTDALGLLITRVHAVESDTEKLESAVSNINVLVQQVFKKTEHISELESETKQLISAISPESLNKTIQELIPAAVMSSTYDLRQQVSELMSALKEKNDTEVIKPAPIIKMDSLQEALQQISELKQNCVSKDELEQRLQSVTNLREVRDTTKVVNKCSVNVRHEPQDGQTHLRLIMDPPNTESANCK